MNISTGVEKIKKRKRFLAFLLSAMVTVYLIGGVLPYTHLLANDGTPEDSSAENPVIQNVYALMASGKEKLLNKDYQGALDDINTAIALSENDIAELYVLRGNINASIYRYSSAIHDYTVALSLDPSLTEIHEIRGHLYYEKKDNENALMDYD